MRVLLCGVLYSLAMTPQPTFQVCVIHSLLTGGKTTSEVSLGRSEYLIISQTLNLTHTYVNNIENVCNI